MLRSAVPSIVRSLRQARHTSSSAAPVQTWLQLKIRTGAHDKTVKIHPLALRERCRDPRFTQVSTGQRYQEVTDLLPLAITAARVQENDLLVDFSDSHQMRLPLSAVLDEALDSQHPYALPQPQPWGTADMAPEQLYFRFDELGGAKDSSSGAVTPSASLLPLITQLFTHGAAVVSGVPRTETAIDEFASSIGVVRDTNWGRVFTVRKDLSSSVEATSSSPAVAEDVSVEDLAYSNAALSLHVDNPYRDPPCGYQMLHVVQAAAPGTGGDSLIADGFYVAEKLRREDPDLFRALASTPLRYEYKDDSTTLVTFLPTLITDASTGDPGDPATQRLVRVVSSGRLDYAPLASDALSSRTHELFYKARRDWYARLHSPDAQLHWRLNDGDLLIVDNLRVLHGRSAFASSQSRLLKGLYTDRDSVTSTYHRFNMHSSTPHSLLSVDVLTLPAQVPPNPTPRSPSLPPLDARVAFTSLVDIDKSDAQLMGTLYAEATTGARLAARACALLHAQRGQHAHLGGQVDLYTHALQTATRAHRDGCSDELVVCALLHDIGELLSPSNHGDVAAGILRPYISREAHWVLAHHEVFQGYYYFEHYDIDRNRRVRWDPNQKPPPDAPDTSLSPPGNAYQLCIDFCARYDAPSFDPAYESMPLSDFVPMLERVFSKKPFWDDPSNAKAGAVTG